MSVVSKDSAESSGSFSDPAAESAATSGTMFSGSAFSGSTFSGTMLSNTGFCSFSSKTADSFDIAETFLNLQAFPEQQEFRPVAGAAAGAAGISVFPAFLPVPALFLFRASRCCRSLHRILHLFRRPDLCMSGNHASCGAFPCSAVHRNALFLLKALQHALSRSFIKISEKRPRLFLYALPELLPALFFILALHLFPFAHDIFE